MHGPLSFETAFGNCRSRSHTPPVIVFGLDGIPCESMENGGIVLQQRNILPHQCGDEGSQDKRTGQWEVKYMARLKRWWATRHTRAQRFRR